MAAEDDATVNEGPEEGETKEVSVNLRCQSNCMCRLNIQENGKDYNTERGGKSVVIII